MNFIDTHIHIDCYDKFPKILSEYEESNIYAIFVTMLPEIFEKHFKKVKTFRHIRLAIGFHPQVLLNYNFNIEIFEEYIQYTNYIGEVGMDLSAPLKHLYDKQANIFSQITNEKFSKGKILSVHSKHAEKDVLSILKKNKVKHAIFHWYSGSNKTMEDIINLGYYFSINPKMGQSDKGKKLIKSIPIDKILFETDAPFIKHNKKTIEPSMYSQLYYDLGNICEVPDFKKVVFNNFKTILKSAEYNRIHELIDTS